MADDVDIPDQVRFAAVHFPSSGPVGPVPPGVQVRDVTGGILVITDSNAMADMPELSPGRVDQALEDVRSALRDAGRTWAYWTMDASRPELIAALKDRGLVENSRPPWEPSFSALALVQEPEGGDPPGVTARPVESLEELHRVGDVLAEVYPSDAAKRAAARDRAPAQFEYERLPDAVSRTYVAFLDGHLVGAANSLFTPLVVNMMGGSVRPDARGRGAYRALVAARWRDAVARETPALTVQAGAMSRPILERVGFVPVGRIEVLLDEL
jgi:hypothetical protein